MRSEWNIKKTYPPKPEKILKVGRQSTDNPAKFSWPSISKYLKFLLICEKFAKFL